MKKILLSIILVSSQVIFSQIYTPGGAVNTTENPATGNVGIGTVNPQAKLEVNGSVYVNSENSFIGADAWNESRLGIVKKSGFGPILATGFSYPFIIGNWSLPNINNNISSGTFTELMRILPNGNVGIGYSNPQSKLTIYDAGASGSNQFELRSNHLRNPDRYFMKNIIAGSGTDDVTFSLRHDGQMFVSGNVGIGYSNPQSKLTIYDAGDIGSSQLELRSNHLRNPTRYFMKNVIAGTGSDDITFSLKHDGEMFVSGNVGIGTTNPNFKLDVLGHVRFNSTTDHTHVFLGKDLNDAIITDSSPSKYYGGGYFFRVNNSDSSAYIDALLISDEGKIGIGKKPQYFLDVNGNASFSGMVKIDAKLEAKEVKVTTTPTADFVFEKDYQLPTLEEVEKHIKENKHLPEIASAKQMEKEGVNVGEFQIKLLQKIEELTLYIIDLKKENIEIKSEIKKLKEQK